MVRDPRESRGRRRRYEDNPPEDEDDEDDEDELSEDEARLGLKVVELAPRAARPNDGRRQSDGKIFHEFHPDHPGGEALVVKGRRVKVYPTAKVQRALGEGLLIESVKPETPLPPQVADLLDQNRQKAVDLRAQFAAGATGQADESGEPGDASASSAAAEEIAPAAARSQASRRR